MKMTTKSNSFANYIFITEKLLHAIELVIGVCDKSLVEKNRHRDQSLKQSLLLDQFLV